jgi:glycosyltransferase involved in cell wall biosynthesis
MPPRYKVSAIVSAFKSERFLRGCLDDLEAQTIADRLEIVIVDSGSPERERDIIAEYVERFDNIVSIRTPYTETVYGAWNRAILMSGGEYITNANTDDRHRVDALEVMARTLDKNPDAGLVYAGYKTTGVANETFEKNTSTAEFLPDDYSRIRLAGGYCFPGPQPMWRSSLHNEYGLFDAELKSAGDLEYWLRISEGTTFMRVPEILGLYLSHPESAEHRDESLSAREAQMVLGHYRSNWR